LNHIKKLPDIVVNLIVITLGIKRRVNITKSNRFIAGELPQNIEIVTVVKFVHRVYSIGENLSLYKLPLARAVGQVENRQRV